MDYKWDKERLTVSQAGQAVGEIGFKMMNDDRTYIVERTWVAEPLRGKGLAAEMTQAFLDHVRTEAKTVLPLCKYTQLYIKRNPAYQDLLFIQRKKKQAQ